MKEQVFEVRFSEAARDERVRLYDFLLDRATTEEDLDLAERALAASAHAMASLRRHPLIYRKAADNPFHRELIIPFGRSGYVALFEVEDAATVTVLALRHQIEDDYY